MNLGMSRILLPFVLGAGMLALPIRAQQDEAPPAPPSTEREELQKSDISAEEQAAKEAAVREKVWMLQARCAAGDLSLDEAMSDEIIDLYTSARRDHFVRCEKERENFLFMKEEYLKENRGQGAGGVGSDPFSDRVLERKIFIASEQARMALAKELVALLDKPRAAKVYPKLAAFNLKMDGLTAILIGWDVNEEGLLECTGAIAQYFIDRAEAGKLARTDRAAFSAAMKKAADMLVAIVTPYIDSDQLRIFRRRMS